MAILKKRGPSIPAPPVVLTPSSVAPIPAPPVVLTPSSVAPIVTPTLRKAGPKIKSSPTQTLPEIVIESKKQPLDEKPPIIKIELPKYVNVNDPKDILAYINRCRRRIIIHSVIYYTFNKNLISDYEFDMLGRELLALHQDYPELSAKAVFSEDFVGYNGMTGYQFAGHAWGNMRADYLLRTGMGGLENVKDSE